MDSFQEDGNWNLIDYNCIMEEAASTDFYWSNESACMELDASPAAVFSQENECSRKRYIFFLDIKVIFLLRGCYNFRHLLPNLVMKIYRGGVDMYRGRTESCSKAGTKACREKMRRDKMNDRFTDLSNILEPGRPAKTDKSAILNDAIRVLNQLRSETQELKDANEKLQEEIKHLKVEKNELREEKLVLKADKERIEQQVKSMNVVPAGFVSPHPAAYQVGVNKMMAYPNYGGFPMWQWIPPTALDTSQDHVLRPPVA